MSQLQVAYRSRILPGFFYSEDWACLSKDVSIKRDTDTGNFSLKLGIFDLNFVDENTVCFGSGVEWILIVADTILPNSA